MSQVTTCPDEQCSERLTLAKTAAEALRVAIAGALKAQSFGIPIVHSTVEKAIALLATAERITAEEVTAAMKADEKAKESK